jgi:hypothetical protein
MKKVASFSNTRRGLHKTYYWFGLYYDWLRKENGVKNHKQQFVVFVLVFILIMATVPLIKTQISFPKAVLTNNISGNGENAENDDTLNHLEPKDQINSEESDVPFTKAETRFLVYPDGRVEVDGSFQSTDLVPKYTGPAMSGFLNLTGNEESSQALAGLTITLPSEIASQFPFNSTTASLTATYSNDILNLGINSEMVLPSTLASQYPFNSTDGIVEVTYSGGMLNVEVNVDTTLPTLASQQFPFNTTDITVTGNYALDTLTGTITFSVSPQFTFDDVEVKFTGTRTH